MKKQHILWPKSFWNTETNNVVSSIQTLPNYVNYWVYEKHQNNLNKFVSWNKSKQKCTQQILEKAERNVNKYWELTQPRFCPL